MSNSKIVRPSDRRQRLTVGLAFAAILLCATTGVFGQAERIHDYHSDIQIRADGSLEVTETITVTAAGDKIKRGIYRDFPTMYTTIYFVQSDLPFEVLSVKRDGIPEPFHTENRSNGVRLYVGEENVRLPRGRYTYEIRYATDFQLGYFDNHDELYWNVTGNGWDFVIEEATASVKLPTDVPTEQITSEAYTGPKGARGRNTTSRIDPETHAVEFATTQALEPYEGLTIVVGFPKGIVREPTAAERRQLYLKANLTLWMIMGGLLVVLIYYIAAWVRVGRDPPGDVIVPQFEPPPDLNPASMRFIRRMGYDQKCFTAAVLNLAAKGALTIEEEDGEYTLRRTDSSPTEPFSAGERIVYKKLLNAKVVKLKQSNHKKIKKAIEKLGDRLYQEFDEKMFRRNLKWLIPGWILSAVVVVAIALSAGWHAVPVAAFMSVWLSIWTLGCVMLGKAVIAAWRSAIALRRNTLKRIGSYGAAIGMTAFATPFFIGEIVGLGVLVAGTTIWMLPMIVGIFAINAAFWHWIKQPTLEGRRVMDEIEGFRMYLGATEKEYLRQLHTPHETPELFERYLPYALALDVGHEWAERFVGVLSKAATAEGNGDGYRPSWYHGSSWHGASAGAFASGLSSSLGGAISSSSTAPGSSSGGGGGGFSGGGGGGGGGGGW